MTQAEVDEWVKRAEQALIEARLQTKWLQNLYRAIERGTENAPVPVRIG